MTVRRVAASLGSAVALTTSMILVVATPGIAVPLDDAAEKVEDTIASVPGQYREDPIDPTLTESGDLTAVGDGVEVGIETHADGAQVTSTKKGVAAEVSLPNEATTGEGVVAPDGTIVFEGKSGSPDVAVQALSTGFRILTVIGASDQPTSYTYELGEGLTPLLEQDGSVSLVREVTATDPDTGALISASVSAGRFAPAWAVDSAGKPVPTRYEVNGTEVVQVVEHDVAGVTYPVTADPKHEAGWVTSWMRFNRAETATLANGGWGAAGLSAICAAIGGPVAASACFLLFAPLVYQAGVAQNSKPKKCVAIKTTVGLPPIATTYSGGYCK